MTTKFFLTPWKIESEVLTDQMPVIDLRSLSLYKQGHLKGASHFPIGTLVERLSELPSRHQVLCLFGTETQIIEASHFLIMKNYRVKYQILACDSFFQQISHRGWLEIGNHSKRLWQPAPVVKRFNKHFSKLTTAKYGLDLACGAGRDSLYLAQSGWQMCAIDYSQSALDKLNKLSENLSLPVETQLLNLEKDFSTLIAQEARYDLIIVVRYLHRPILEMLPLLLKSRGILVYQTFMQGCEAFGSPKNPRFLLKAGELAETFNNFNILYDHQELLEDGRPTNAFIAQKHD
ncbi:MAG: methyltransferase domain-containing protein [Enterobacterales bacterium]|nr:methyltransferase domain-containing protein [Enterobacterales bacterium]